MEPIASARSDNAGLASRAVARAQQGDTSAIHFLYLRYGDVLQRHVKSITGDGRVAEEITEGVFASLTTVIGEYQPRELRFAVWILRLAERAAFDRVGDRPRPRLREIREER